MKNNTLLLAEREGFEPSCALAQTDFESAPLWPLRYLSILSFWKESTRKSDWFRCQHDIALGKSVMTTSISLHKYDATACIIFMEPHSNGSTNLFVESTSHSQLGGRGACSPDEELANHRRRRYISPWCILYIFDRLNFNMELLNNNSSIFKPIHIIS